MIVETAYLQVEENLLEADALERLGWTNFLNFTFLKRCGRMPNR